MKSEPRFVDRGDGWVIDDPNYKYEFDDLDDFNEEDLKPQRSSPSGSPSGSSAPSTPSLPKEPVGAPAFQRIADQVGLPLTERRLIAAKILADDALGSGARLNANDKKKAMQYIAYYHVMKIYKRRQGIRVSDSPPLPPLLPKKEKKKKLTSEEKRAKEEEKRAKEEEKRVREAEKKAKREEKKAKKEGKKVKNEEKYVPKGYMALLRVAEQINHDVNDLKGLFQLMEEDRKRDIPLINPADRLKAYRYIMAQKLLELPYTKGMIEWAHQAIINEEEAAKNRANRRALGFGGPNAGQKRKTAKGIAKAIQGKLNNSAELTLRTAPPRLAKETLEAPVDAPLPERAAELKQVVKELSDQLVSVAVDLTQIGNPDMQTGRSVVSQVPQLRKEFQKAKRDVWRTAHELAQRATNAFPESLQQSGIVFSDLPENIEKVLSGEIPVEPGAIPPPLLPPSVSSASSRSTSGSSQKSTKKKKKTNKSFPPPTVRLVYQYYQLGAVNKFLENPPGTGLLITFPVGTGKTFASISCGIAQLEKIRTLELKLEKPPGWPSFEDLGVLVVTTKAVVDQFERELRTLSSIRERESAQSQRIAEDIRNKFRFTHYNSNKWQKSVQYATPFGFPKGTKWENIILIVDEAHLLRNYPTKKWGKYQLKAKQKAEEKEAAFTKTANILINKIEKAWKVVLLTATPIYTENTDLLALLNFVVPKFTPRNDAVAIGTAEDLEQQLAKNEGEQVYNIVDEDIQKYSITYTPTDLIQVTNPDEEKPGSADIPQTVTPAKIQIEHLKKVNHLYSTEELQKFTEDSADLLSDILKQKQDSFYTKSLVICDWPKELVQASENGKDTSGVVAPKIAAVIARLRAIQEIERKGSKHAIHTKFVQEVKGQPLWLNYITRHILAAFPQGTVNVYGLYGGTKDPGTIIHEFNQLPFIPGHMDILLFTKASATGVEYQGIRSLHILEPDFSDAYMQQVKGRVIRKGSHKRAPYKWVDIYTYVLDGFMVGKNKISSADQMVEGIMNRRRTLNQLFKDRIREKAEARRRGSPSTPIKFLSNK